jgi:hypothetical protein
METFTTTRFGARQILFQQCRAVTLPHTSSALQLWVRKTPRGGRKHDTILTHDRTCALYQRKLPVDIIDGSYCFAFLVFEATERPHTSQYCQLIDEFPRRSNRCCMPYVCQYKRSQQGRRTTLLVINSSQPLTPSIDRPPFSRHILGAELPSDIISNSLSNQVCGTRIADCSAICRRRQVTPFL